MTATTASARPSTASLRTTALTLLAAIVVAVAATWTVSVAAIAAGAEPGYPPLQPAVFGTFAALGVLIGYAGWRLVRRLVPRPAAVLRMLVPVAVVLSLVPDLVLLLTGFIPGTTVPGVVGLMVMHPIVAGVVVPVAQRLAPVR